VDDDRATNFYHSIIIRDMNICDEIVQVKNGQEAFDYIQQCQTESKAMPDYIFIDRHMPVLDGFEFIDKLDETEFSTKDTISVILLSTLLSEPDNELVKSYLKRESVLKACFKKPLTEALINELTSKNSEA